MGSFGRGLVAIALAIALSGCATYLGRAKRAYAQGRYLEVSEELGRHEEDLPYLSPTAQIDYGIYRGLALISLGDARAAHRWLAYASQVEKDNPGSMRDEQHAALDHAFAQLPRTPAPVAPPPPPPSPEPPTEPPSP